MAPQRRTAALVISAFVEPEANPPWFARISYYRDALSPAVDGPPQTSVESICDTVRAWIESVAGDQAPQDES